MIIPFLRIGLLLPLSLWAASPLGLLQGDVLDSRTGQPVLRAQIQVERILQGDDSTTVASPNVQVIQADSLGHFALHLPTGPVDLVVTAPSYFRHRITDVEIRTGASPLLRIPLEDLSVRDLGSTTVKAKALAIKDPMQSTSVTRLTRDQVNNSPGSSQDINRVLSSLPSVAMAADDNFNAFLVRGGGTSENGFLVDGIEVANLSHWGDEYSNGGAVGMLHLDFVRDLDFYAGGMPAYLPPKLSSITDIRLREGSFDKRNWQLDLNMAGAGVFLEGPIVPQRASYLASARVSFLQAVAWMMPYNGVPEYRNASTKTVWKLGPQGKLSWNLMAGDESISMDNDAEGTMISNGRHLISGLEWQLGRADWNNRLLLSGMYSEFGARQTASELEVFDFRNHDRKLLLKDNLDFYLGHSDILTVGAVVEQRKQDEHFTNPAYWLAWQDSSFHYVRELPVDYPDSLWRDSLGGTQQGIDTVGYRMGAHATYVWKPDPWTVQIGTRNDYYTLLDRHGLSPRLAVTRELAGNQAWSMSAALQQQFPDSKQLMDLVANDSGYSLQQIRLQRAWVGALGWRKAISEQVDFDGELYAKWYDRELRHHINDSIGDREVVPDAKNNWHRKAAGLEFHLQKNRKDIFFYELAYSLGFAWQEYDDGSWQVADGNLRNSSHIILGSRLSKEHTISSRIDISEGRPYTPIDTVRSLAEYQTVYRTQGGWNQERREPIFNLSLRYSHNSYYDWGRVESYTEVTNLLNRTYVVEEGFDRGSSPDDGSIDAFHSRGFFFVGGVAVNW